MSVWTPKVDNPYIHPELEAITIHIHKSDFEIISSKLIENPVLPIDGEWYKVVSDINNITITFDANNTPYSRSIAIYLILAVLDLKCHNLRLTLSNKLCTR